MKLKILFALLLSQLCYSQVWVNSLDEAKKLAKATNKLILVDFNADWCKPCKMMESEFFYNEKYKNTLNKFVAVSINIDFNRQDAQQYGVTSIPNIKIIDIKGDVIYEVLGYYGAERTNEEFINFPENTEDLYDNLNFANPKIPTDEEQMSAGTYYQILAQKTSKNAKKSFIGMSNTYFNKCIKVTKNNNLKEVAELGKAFNSVLLEIPKKAIKSIDLTKISKENLGYARYILAKAYFDEGNKAEGNKIVEEIENSKDENWLSAAKALKNKYN